MRRQARRTRAPSLKNEPSPYCFHYHTVHFVVWHDASLFQLTVQQRATATPDEAVILGVTRQHLRTTRLVGGDLHCGLQQGCTDARLPSKRSWEFPAEHLPLFSFLGCLFKKRLPQWDDGAGSAFRYAPAAQRTTPPQLRPKVAKPAIIVTCCRMSR